MANTFTQVFDQIKSEPKVGLYTVCALVTLVWIVTALPKLFGKSTPSRPPTPDLDKPSARSFKAPPREPGGK